MKKAISCGSVIVKDNKLLIAKPYKNKTWNIPKGKLNPKETFWDAAVRETFEECNVDINRGFLIRELGTFKYLKDKNLHLYLVVINYEPELKCNSLFEDRKTKKQVPEMVGFKWIEFNEYHKYFSPSMSVVFDVIVPTITKIIKNN